MRGATGPTKAVTSRSDEKPEGVEFTCLVMERIVEITILSGEIWTDGLLTSSIKGDGSKIKDEKVEAAFPKTENTRKETVTGVKDEAAGTQTETGRTTISIPYLDQSQAKGIKYRCPMRSRGTR
jgi:hypothetical protein